MIEEKTKVTNNFDLPDCARHLARLWPTMPLEVRPHVSKLAEQIKNFPHNPDGLRPMIQQTIERIENAA